MSLEKWAPGSISPAAWHKYCQPDPGAAGPLRNVLFKVVFLEVFLVVYFEVFLVVFLEVFLLPAGPTQGLLALASWPEAASLRAVCPPPLSWSCRKRRSCPNYFWPLLNHRDTWRLDCTVTFDRFVINLPFECFGVKEIFLRIVLFSRESLGTKKWRGGTKKITSDTICLWIANIFHHFCLKQHSQAKQSWKQILIVIALTTQPSQKQSCHSLPLLTLGLSSTFHLSRLLLDTIVSYRQCPAGRVF